MSRRALEHDKADLRALMRSAAATQNNPKAPANSPRNGDYVTMLRKPSTPRLRPAIRVFVSRTFSAMGFSFKRLICAGASQLKLDGSPENTGFVLTDCVERRRRKKRDGQSVGEPGGNSSVALPFAGTGNKSSSCDEQKEGPSAHPQGICAICDHTTLSPQYGQGSLLTILWDDLSSVAGASLPGLFPVRSTVLATHEDLERTGHPQKTWKLGVSTIPVDRQ